MEKLVTWFSQTRAFPSKFRKPPTVQQLFKFRQQPTATSRHEIPAETPARQHHFVFFPSLLASRLKNLANKVVRVIITLGIYKFPERNHIFLHVLRVSMPQEIRVRGDIVNEFRAVREGHF